MVGDRPMPTDVSLAVARHVPVQPSSRALSSLGRIDYEDAFVIGMPPGQAVPATDWAKAALEGATSRLGRELWSALATIGVLPRAQPARSERVIVGWAVRRATPEVAVLAADAPLGLCAELLFETRQRIIRWSTFVQLDTAPARAAWAVLAPVHRRVVTYLLERVVRLDLDAPLE